MHLFEPQVVSMSTENGNGSQLDVFVRVQLTTGYDTRIIIFMH